MGAVKERDYRKECARLRKRVQMLEKKYRNLLARNSDLEECGFELDLEETVQLIEVFDDEVEDSQPTAQDILKEFKRKRMRMIENDN